MGKKKKTKGPPPARPPTQQVGGRGGGGGGAHAFPGDDSDGGADEPTSGGAEWLQEQKRLLELYSGEKADHASSGGGHGSGGAAGDAGSAAGATEAAIEKQRQLLEEAAASRPAAASSSTSSGCGGGGAPRGPPPPAAAPPALPPAPGGGRASSSTTSPAGVPGAGPGKQEEVFPVRKVSFYGRQVPTLLQSRNGPCALLAVANCLLLRGTLTLQEDEVLVSSGSLVRMLGDLCRRLNEKSMKQDSNMREGISEVVGRLPLLLDGLLLNCGFASCSDFELTADIGLFDCLGLNLYHVWVAPEIATVAATWNALAERLAVCAELREQLERERRPPTDAEDEQLTHGLLLEQWHDTWRAQATPQGLEELLHRAAGREVCVLFRNNHFSTLYKPSKEALCTLLTDAAFEEEAAAVWESVELDGSTGHILGADFKPFSPSGGGGDPGQAAQTAPSTAVREELLSLVESMGFDRDLAEAGLEAVGWAGAEEAIEAILEADGDVPKPRKVSGSASGVGDVNSCPTCGKVFKSKNGLLNHRSSKNH